MNLKVSAISDVGKVRDINEDNYCVINNVFTLLVVADGMGGHNAGEIASAISIDKIKRHIMKYITLDMEDESIKGIIFEAFNRANKEIFERANANMSCDGMGTTTTLALYINSQLFVGHIGDSRAYIIRNGTIEQITEDHSLVAELVRNGSITETEAMRHPQKNVITKALGTNKNIKADVFKMNTEPKDILVLCTDGLSNFIQSVEIEKVVSESNSIEEACERLVLMANKRGGYDNITVLIAKNDEVKFESR